MGWLINVMPWTIYSKEKELVPIVWESGWAKELVWMGMENSGPHQGSNPRPFSLQQVTILTTLSWLLCNVGLKIYSMKCEQMCWKAFVRTKHDITLNRNKLHDELCT